MAEMERTEILRVNLLKENNTSSLEFKEFPGTIIGKKVPSHKLQVRKNRTRESQRPRASCSGPPSLLLPRLACIPERHRVASSGIVYWGTELGVLVGNIG